MRRAALLTGLVVAAAAFAVHAQTLGAGFVYDDHRFVEENPAIRNVDPVAFFADPGTASAHSGIEPDVYRPLRTLDYAIDHAVFGVGSAWGWHLENLLWHALAAFLVFRLLRPLVREDLLAAGAGAALFAVHPVTSEAVAWISSRGDLMAVALLAGALVILERPGLARTVAGTALAVLACVAKESAVVAPALLPLRDLALPRTVAPTRATTIRRTALLALCVAAYLGVRLGVIPTLGQVEQMPGGSRAATARGMAAGLAWYADVLVRPHGFPFDAMLPIPLSWGEPAVVIGIGLLATLLLAGAYGLRSRRGLLAFATLGALVALLPVSNVIVPLKTLVAERFLYPVLVAVAAGVALLVMRARGTLRWVAAGLSVLAIALLGQRTFERDPAWASDETLWNAVRVDRPDNPRAYEGIGFAALRRGHVVLAENAYRSYLEWNPDDGKSWMLLGNAYGLLARTLYVRNLEPGATTNVDEQRRAVLEAQLSTYRKALAAWGRVGLVRGRGSPQMLREAHESRFDAAFRLDALEEARDANEALATLDRQEGRGPDEALRRNLARLTLALVSALTPLEKLSARTYERARAARTRLLEDLGIDPLLDGPRLLERLLALHEEILRAVPDHAEATANLAQILVELGRKDEAIRRLRAFVERHPERRDLLARLAGLERSTTSGSEGPR